MSNIQPFLLARLGPLRTIVVGHVVQRAGDEQLVGSAQVGPPVDVVACTDQRRERRVAVEQDDDVVDAGREAWRTSRAGGDLDRPPDPVERDAMAGGQQLRRC